MLFWICNSVSLPAMACLVSTTSSPLMVDMISHLNRSWHSGTETRYQVYTIHCIVACISGSSVIIIQIIQIVVFELMKMTTYLANQRVNQRPGTPKQWQGSSSPGSLWLPWLEAPSNLVTGWSCPTPPATILRSVNKSLPNKKPWSMEPYLLQFHPQHLLNPRTENCQKLNLFEAAISPLANSRGDSMTEEREKAVAVRYIRRNDFQGRLWLNSLLLEETLLFWLHR